MTAAARLTVEETAQYFVDRRRAALDLRRARNAKKCEAADEEGEEDPCWKATRYTPEEGSGDLPYDSWCPSCQERGKLHEEMLANSRAAWGAARRLESAVYRASRAATETTQPQAEHLLLPFGETT